MIRKAYIRYREDMPESTATYSAQDGFRQLGVETAPFYGFGDVELLDVGPEVAVCGYIGDVLAGLERCGARKPEPLDYPGDLFGYLGRNIWRSTLDAVTSGTFVKPVRHKLFTGRMWHGNIHDRIALAGIEETEPVWCSQRVNFSAEFRCFVLEDRLLDVRRYRGDWHVGPDLDTVTSAVMAYASAPAAYALDFGVTDEGKTLLVEANDGFSLGPYGLDPVLYARMIAARWQELASRKETPKNPK